MLTGPLFKRRLDVLFHFDTRFSTFSHLINRAGEIFPANVLRNKYVRVAPAVPPASGVSASLSGTSSFGAEFNEIPTR